MYTSLQGQQDIYYWYFVKGIKATKLEKYTGLDTVCKLDWQESRDKDYSSEGLRYWESTTKNDDNYNNSEKCLIISNCLAKGVVSGSLILVDSMF